MIEIDLEKPDKLLASAENAKDYTFLLVLPKPAYTKEALEQNPNCVAAADLLFKSPAVPDENGKASFDLAAKAKEIKDKLTEAKTEARAVLLGTEKSALARRKVVIEPVILKKDANSIKLKGLVAQVAAQNWVAYHHPILFVEMVVKGEIREVIYDVTPKTGWNEGGQGYVPMVAVWEQDQPGSHGIRKMILGSAGDPHAPTPKCTLPQSFHRGSWWDHCWKAYHQFALSKGVENYVIGVYPRGPGNIVLTVKGAPPYDSKKDQITLSMNGPHPSPGD